MIWSRYIISECLKVFALVFFALFFLATLIDFSAHMKSFWQEAISLRAIFLYYLAQLSRQAEIFLSIALLLANIKVLSTSTVRGEVVALCTAGVSLRRLTYPLGCVALVAMGLLYLNIEFFQPKALRHLSYFEESFFKSTGKEDEVMAIALEDQSRLLYGSFDPEKQRFKDVFWIRDFDHVLHMEELSPFERCGYHVSSLERTNGELIPVTCTEEQHFPDMSFESRSLSQATLPIDWQPLSQLWRQLPLGAGNLRDYEAKAVALFFQKLTAPLLALLVFLAPAPFCLQFGRERKIFRLYALSLAGFLCYSAATQATAILGKSYIFSPFIVVALLPLLALTIFGVRYAKL